MSLFLRLAEVIGHDGAIALFREFPGERVYVPDVIKPDHKLAVLLSFEVAERLCFLFGGARLDIPTGNPKGFKSQRLVRIENYLIGELRSQGWSISMIAVKLKMTRRAIHKRLRKKNLFPLEDRSLKGNNQLSLFSESHAG